MVQLNDGRIRVAVGKDEATVLLHTTNAEGTEWEDSQTLPEEIGQSGIINTNLALSPDGSVFCTTYQENPEDKTYTHHLWMVDPEGTARELSLDGMTVDPAEVWPCLRMVRCSVPPTRKTRRIRPIPTTCGW